MNFTIVIKQKDLPKTTFSNWKFSVISEKTLPYLVSITGSCVHLIVLVSHVSKKAGNKIDWRHGLW